ncbi:MAG: ABC transporter ATP-binding protein [Brevefilum sp.]|jgi:multiple sugar transport system ATP-binding protein
MEIRLEGLTKNFGEVVAVNDLNVTFPSGKLIALLGPSGCGKSTLLYMISGIVPATKGRIYFNEVDVTKMAPEKRRVGLVFQNYALYPHMSVLQNICFPLEMQKVPKQERLERAHQIAEIVHIGDLMDRKPAELSGGQQQRVAITRALVKNPDLLLLDEPLSNLDARLRIEMREEIRRIQSETGVTTIFVTHDQEEAMSISDSILLIKEGVEQQYQNSQELYNNPANLFVAQFLGNPPINRLEGKIRNGRFELANSTDAITLAAELQTPEETNMILGVRAESIFLQPDNSSDCFYGTINEIYRMGKEELFHLKIGEQEVRGYLSTDKELNIGDEIPIGLKKKGVFLFDQVTGERYL